MNFSFEIYLKDFEWAESYLTPTYQHIDCVTQNIGSVK